MFREEATKALAGFHAGPLSWSNWNLECKCLWREKDRRTPRKTLGARTRTNNKLNPHDTGPELNPGHILVGDELSHHYAIPAPHNHLATNTLFHYTL